MRILLAAMTFAMLISWISIGHAGQQPMPIQPEVTDKTRDREIRQQLEKQIEKAMRNTADRARIVEEAQERTALCKHCHGADGIAIRPLVPNLAGQNPVYLLDQFLRFSTGRRYDYLMSGLAKLLTREEKIKLAIYYSGLPAKPSGGGSPVQIRQGQRIFADVCSKCHGEDGRGREGYARLAGQRSDYVVKMLREFRDRTGQRSSLWMTGVALRLSEKDMHDVAAYVANLN